MDDRDGRQRLVSPGLRRFCGVSRFAKASRGRSLLGIARATKALRGITWDASRRRIGVSNPIF